MAKFARRMMVPIVALLTLWCATPALASVKAGWDINETPVGESAGVQWKGNLTLTETKEPLIGSTAVKCEETAEGTVKPRGLGEITKWTNSSCVGGSEAYACEKSRTVTVEPLHLPWRTELVMVEGVPRETVVSGGKGAPGYKITCTVDGVKLETECSGTLNTTTKNISGGVSAAFIAAEKLNCSAGGTGSGVLEGTQTITASAGGSKLSVQTEEPPEWLRKHEVMTVSQGAEWTGTVKLEDKHGSLLGLVGVECASVIKGSVGPAAAGELKTWTLSNCKPSPGSGCENNSSSVIEVLHLPWTTALARVGSGIRDLFSTSGEAPAFQLKCRVGGLSVSTECSRVPATRMSNIAGGNSVAAAFPGTEELLDCTIGEFSGVIEGSQTIWLDSAEPLEIS